MNTEWGGNTPASGKEEEPPITADPHRKENEKMEVEVAANNTIQGFPMHGNRVAWEKGKKLKKRVKEIKTKSFGLSLVRVKQRWTIQVIAQRIIIPVGPTSRKRPRREEIDSDPFLIDDIIKEIGIRDKVSGKSSANSPIPDLNSAMGGTSGDPLINQELGNSIDLGEDLVGNEEVEKEIQATIEIGRKLGIDLRNKEEMVKAAIQGEENLKGYQ
ncbi:hypothetical protein L1987_85905 [Smallanthus sonchifolius]|uniref:Uncharacterized protein n=1 Tax=Smallanthus sonchifolius TaxID=185202 RepID=A0ACB8XZ28_9ASTR|nr:hypothetical protein L1987_85905 [Smallanthus sonchifolius]